jgi:hypothetical protein
MNPISAAWVEGEFDFWARRNTCCTWCSLIVFTFDERHPVRFRGKGRMILVRVTPARCSTGRRWMRCSSILKKRDQQLSATTFEDHIRKPRSFVLPSKATRSILFMVD